MTAATATTKVTLNDAQRLYVIEGEQGYSCLGYDVCERRIAGIARWLGITPAAHQPGTEAAYAELQSLLTLGHSRYATTRQRCPAELTPQLVGLEGKRVEVVDSYGETRRFHVGRSTGWLPIHLEIARRDSRGGGGVTGAPFRSVRVVGTR